MTEDVALVLDFLNTVDRERGTDLLDDPVAWDGWLAERGLARGDVDPAGVRATLRAAVGDPVAGVRPVHVPVTASVVDGVPRVVAPDVVGAVLAAASRLVVLGRWDRVKVCPADDCRWAFYDRSRNHSRTWCSMQVCGNRRKARGWRERAARR
ncbi:CGNR zinc finger domain-containing protein [Actinophytocola gossypii]|uniref:CGNR zinc finger domain-containing protein n=1 Tax=Actinophytocola gossypii TaxID=2812003 RepID=A0ABT2JD02_9PSEU|nr:CGNR zinc finger domain-containing protein [Actinophytocola gossypii]MCT2585725.1 CGNR zinc finger domain-containing protein [Actinophytocola gossypii]